MRGRKRNAVATEITEGKNRCHGRTTGKARKAKGAATVLNTPTEGHNRTSVFRQMDKKMTARK